MLLPRRCRRLFHYIFVVYCLLMLFWVLLGIRKNFIINEQSVEQAIVQVQKKVRKEAEIPVSDSYETSPFRVQAGENVGQYFTSKDFPLTNGLTNPQPLLRVGRAIRNATFAIGVPSIRRNGRGYLFASVQSLFDNLSSAEKESVVIVVFLAEEDSQEYLDETMRNFTKVFPKEIERGNLEIIAPAPSFYPHNWAEAVLPRFGDGVTRAKWRSKQNLDQVFLMMYAYHIFPSYYLMMEDDIIASKDYYKDMIKAIQTRNKIKWFYISFCTLGAIGKLFPRKILPKYASFIHTLWNIKPLDWIQIDFAKARVCGEETEEMCSRLVSFFAPSYVPSLFQHVGRTSSLPGKVQNLTDAQFENG